MNGELATSRGLRNRALEWILLRLCREIRVGYLDTHFLASNVFGRDEDMLGLTPEILWDEFYLWAQRSWLTLQRIAVQIWMLCLLPLMCISPKVLRLRFREWQQDLDRNDLAELVQRTALLVVGRRSAGEGVGLGLPSAWCLSSMEPHWLDSTLLKKDGSFARLTWMTPEAWQETLDDLADIAEWNSWIEGETDEAEWFARWEGAQEVPAHLDTLDKGDK